MRRTNNEAKPFIKWVGGKSQLIEQLDAQLPNSTLITGMVLPISSHSLEVVRCCFICCNVTPI